MSRFSSKQNPEFDNLIKILRWRAIHQPARQAYTFLLDGETEAVHLSYGELDEQARAIATWLQHQGFAGERALLLYPPGLEFISAFFGCLYAGVVAIPVYPPRPNRSISRIQAIVADAEAKVALTTTSLFMNTGRWLTESPDLATLRWQATDNGVCNWVLDWQEPTLNSDTLAFLQYTSGSTGNPKGVMVSHGNLMRNSADLDRGWEHTSESVLITWLPTFHDMGLIYGVIQPLYKGFPCYLMAPVSFLMRPIRWLQAISRYKGTHSGAPNFAYELCVRKIPPEQRTTLDLSSWCMALNGAEPVRADLLKRFAEAFEPCGFNFAAFSPGYGLAEATLKVTAVRKKDTPNFYRIQAEALAKNQVIEATEHQENVQTLVGCGRTEIDTKIRIVNPEALVACIAEEVGEIWVSGSTVAQGYWKRPEETQKTFQAFIEGTNEGPFLRTGDLGFLKEGELFVTGRIKDVIIIRGRNYYPQDIEFTVEHSHPALRLGCCAVFEINVKNQEQLVVVQEVERGFLRKLDAERVIGNIWQSLKVEYDLQVYAILLLKPGSIPKTSSGKIQRHACRVKFLDGTLDVVASSSR